MDKCINALLKFTRDNIFTRFIKIAKNKYCAKENDIIKSHSEGLKIPFSKIIKSEKTKWLVESTADEFSYDVIKVICKEVCDVPDCKLKCRERNICIHIHIYM